MGVPKIKPKEVFDSENSVDEEAATVVIDFAALRKEFDAKEGNDATEIDIQFQVHQEEPSHPKFKVETQDIVKTKTILFDFGGSYLSSLYHKESDDHFEFIIVKDLSELNQYIKKEKKLNIIFYYNQSPKAINSLMKQINLKFSHIFSLIIAENLSPQKASMHQKTESGAKAYISSPQNFTKVIEVLKER